MKGTIISISPHIVKVERFEIPSIRDYHEDSVEWENAWNLWDILASANWELPVHEESRDFKEDFSHENGKYFCICRKCEHQFKGHKRRTRCKLCMELELNQPVTIKEIKNGKAILL